MQRLTGLAALAAAAGLALFAMPAAAEGFFGDLVNEFSLRGPKHAPIDYHERAPLVVPKSIDLPKPEAGNPGVAAASWPKEDDGLSAADREDADPNVPATERWRYIAVTTGQYPVSPQELEHGRAAMRNADDLNLPAGLGYYDDGRLDRAALRKGTVKNKGPIAAFVGEPPRRRLTDPPTGYRTPAADAAWGPGGPVAKPHRNDPYAANEAADQILQTVPPAGH
ncbi:MAG TPA: hypothetical protein VHD15_16925 [Hyphomicrobiales bacterium]|nr:hypothetical protein [Hyphomicrobiales bacterium]